MTRVRAKIIRFPSRIATPALRQPKPAIVIVLPVIRIERHENEQSPRESRRGTRPS